MTRIADEVTGEEPEVRIDVELGAHIAIAVLAAGLENLGDAVEHQHRRQRQLRIAGAEELLAPAGQQILIAKRRAPFAHDLTASAAQPLNRPCSPRAALELSARRPLVVGHPAPCRTAGRISRAGVP
jgi:hypothetical protein